MGMCKPADLVDNVNRLFVGKILFNTVQTGREDSHQTSVPVVIFAAPTAFEGVSVSHIVSDRLVCSPPDVIGISIRRKCAVFKPHNKVVHDIPVINRSLLANAVKKCQCEAAVICPGSCRKIKCPVSAHTRDRMAGDLFSRFKLYGAAQCIPDHYSHDTVFPIFIHHFSMPSF